jgi:DNA-binding FadR family transcriptional regulator
MLSDRLDSDLLRYIVAHKFQPGDRLPPLEDLSAELKISIGKLREQLEVARGMGLVEVKPRTGIRLSEYSFFPAVRLSLLFALAGDAACFDAFGALRNHIEASFWHEAVALLTPEDHAYLQELVRRAWAKLNGQPIQIPHGEHRDLHLAIFRRLNNPFVKGLLEAYWEAYEAVGLSLFSDYHYLREVWTYHESIVNAIMLGDVDKGYELLIKHTSLLRYRDHRTPETGEAAASPVLQP